MRSLMVSLLCTGALFAADVMSDGSRVHYESYGTGPEAVVFIHGWTCDLTFWRAQAPIYTKQRALLIDLPGHGASDKPDVAYTQERFARAVEAAMRDAGVEHGVLVGHSMGGAVAYEFLRLFPKQTQALVLVDAFIPSTPKDEAERQKLRAQMDPFLKSFRAPTYKETAGKMIEGMFSAKTTPAQREEIRSKMTATPQYVMASAMQGMFDLEGPKAGETFALPVKGIFAASPRTKGTQAQLRAVFPNVKYEEWEGSGHFLMMESPDRFNTALAEFLTTVKTSK